MTHYQSDLLRTLADRGYIHQITDADALDKLASDAIVPGYVGFDATAPSLHVGNLVSVMLLRRLQQAGHKPIVLLGLQDGHQPHGLPRLDPPGLRTVPDLWRRPDRCNHGQ